MKFNFNNVQSKKEIDVDPKLHVIAGPVKIGKSTVLNELSAKYNWLICDTQKISGYNNLQGGKIIRIVELEPPMSSEAIERYKNDYKMYEELMAAPQKDIRKIKEYKQRLDSNKYWETYERRSDLRENEFYLKDIIDFYNEVDDNNNLINKCEYDGIIIDLLDVIDSSNSWLEYNAARKWCSNNPTFILDKSRISILDLPGIQGSRGWEYLRYGFMDLLADLIRVFKKVITVVHFKDKYVVEQGKINENKVTQSLALRGKSGELLLSECDAFGFMTADGNKRTLSYKKSKATLDSRALHLHDQEILISEFNKQTGKVETNWDKIYLNYATKNTAKSN